MSARPLATWALIAALPFLAACEPEKFGFEKEPPLSVPIEPAPDSSGVITFPDFRVAVAREGDSISTVAARVGVEPVVLARYNGLPLDYLVRPGERLAIPDGPQVAAVQSGWTPEVVTGALDTLPVQQETLPPPAEAPGTQLVRHVVERGETAYSIARLYGVSVTALASWNGLDSDLAVEPGRSLVIPPKEGVPARVEPVAAAPVPEPGTRSPAPPPPSAAEPLPDDEPAPADAPPLPDISLDPEPVAAMRFALPVTGKVVKGFSAAPGKDKSEGIDYQTAAGAPVKAAGAGEVALVSRSLGGLGTIVLIRHRDDLMTVYGRVTDVTVEKGQSVRQGQTIGKVADGSPPILHFEIRRGTESVDPAPYLR